MLKQDEETTSSLDNKKKEYEVKTINEMSKSQVRYETKRAAKNEMSLEQWIDYKNEKNNPTVYHYTKGIHLPSIISEGFIRLESDGSIKDKENAYYNTERYLWLTTELNMPACALPYHYNIEDRCSVGYAPNVSKGIYRFAFKVKTFNNIIKFNDSKLVQQLENRRFRNGPLLDYFKRTAHQDTNNWFVSDVTLPINEMKIEQLVDASWTEENLIQNYDVEVLKNRMETEGTWVDVSYLSNEFKMAA